MAMFNIMRKPKGLSWGAIAVLTAAVFGATAGLEWAGKITNAAIRTQTVDALNAMRPGKK